jgi:hypothetical protein
MFESVHARPASGHVAVDEGADDVAPELSDKIDREKHVHFPPTWSATLNAEDEPGFKMKPIAGDRTLPSLRSR